jgi:hypothetical protein
MNLYFRLHGIPFAMIHEINLHTTTLGSLSNGYQLEYN